ncbi:MAG: NosD domain-containing protein, partial [Myxococcota bacterium]|nr:NosD domain-containing protein [Myxococcota bacterium]
MTLQRLLVPSLLAVWLFPASALGVTLRVPEDYPSISLALEAAVACDTVVVGAGLWEEIIHVPNGVSLVADDSEGPVTIDGGGYAGVEVPMDQVVTMTGGTLLQGFHVQGAREGVAMYGNWAELRDNVFSDVAYGARLSGGTGVLVGNRVIGAENKGFEGNNASIWLEDNVFSGGGVGIDLFQSNGRVRGNTISGNDQGITVRESHFEITANEVLGNEVGITASSGELIIQANRVEGSVLGLEVLEGAHRVFDNELVANEFALMTLFASSEIIGNLVEGSTFMGISEGIGSQSRIANNRFVANEEAFEGQFSTSHVHNNLFSGGGRGIVLQSSDARVVNNIFSGVGSVAVGVDSASLPTLSFNLYWDNVTDFSGWTSDGTDLFADPLLDNQGLPAEGSPAEGAGSSNPDYLGPDGSLPDIGVTGGPDAGTGYTAPEATPPYVGSQSITVIPEGSPTPIFVTNVNDIHGDWLKFNWDIDASDGLDYCDGFTNAVDFTAADDGDYTLYLLVEDSEGFSVAVEVPVEAYNEPPWLDVTFFDELAEGMPAHIWLSAEDPSPEDPVETSFDEDSDGSPELVGLETGFLHWTPLRSGEWTVTFRAADDDGGLTEWTETLWVANLPPVLLVLPPTQMYLGETLDLALLVEDPSPEDEVGVSLENAPEGMKVEDFRLGWTPSPSQVGGHAYDLVVSDGEGASETYFLAIEVLDEVGCGCAQGPVRGGEAWSAGIVLGLV